MAGSLKPSEAKSGGLLDDADVVIKNARFVKYDWPKKDGTRGQLRLALALTVEPVMGGQEHIEYLSAGDLKFFTPTADGKGYDQVADKTALYKSCNAMQFLESLVAKGFPENRLTGDISVIERTKVHVQRIAAPKRKFQDGRQQKDDATILVVTKVIEVPGGAGASADPTDAAIGAVKSVLAANAGRIESAKLATEVFKALMTNPQRNDVLRVITPDFLAKHSGSAWLFDTQAGLVIAA